MLEKHHVISQSRNRLVKISLYVQSGIPVIVEICSGTPPMNMHGDRVNAFQLRGARQDYFLTGLSKNKFARKGVEKQSVSTGGHLCLPAI